MSKKSNNGKKSKALAVVGVIVLVGAAGFLGWLWGMDWMFSSNPKQSTPDLDGVIEKREWARAAYTIPFYLDVDNTIDSTVGKSNVDGWNYMYVTEDANNYYVALDLCSDRTNNKEGEWISFQLANRLPDTPGSKLAFQSLEDIGYEYLFYNVSDDTVFNHQYEPGIGVTSYYDIPIVPEIDTMTVIRGDVSGDHYDFWTEYDSNSLIANSMHYESEGVWLAGDFIDIHFAVNITEKLPDEEISTFLSAMTDMDLRIRLQSNLTSNPVGHFGIPTQYYFAIAEHGGMPGNFTDGFFLSDPNELPFAANASSIITADLNHLNINASTGMFYFSIHCWNDEDGADPTAFGIEIDKIELKFTTAEMQAIVGNSIAPGNYDIAYTFGSSENCPEDHRMFEFKMAKNELPSLSDEMLYINVAGYGTMLIVGTNYWVYPHYGLPLPPLYSSVDQTLDFIPLDMSII